MIRYSQLKDEAKEMYREKEKIEMRQTNRQGAEGERERQSKIEKKV